MQVRKFDLEELLGVGHSFWRETLRRFLEVPPTVLELAESIDMLRILDGYRVKLVESPYNTHAVDVPEDVPKVRSSLSTE